MNVHGDPWGLSLGLGSLPVISPGRTRSVSAENPTGEKGEGAIAVPDPANPDLPHSAAALDLGQGWKVRPFLRPKAGETVDLMDVTGPGILEHIWIGTEDDWQGNGRACVLRFYWDDESDPSVEVPLTDFFAVGHDLFAPVDSLPVVVNPMAALNCFWPMPFQSRARVTFTNELDREVHVGFQITYEERALPANLGRFHAQWRRSTTTRERPEHVILDDVAGAGHYVGTFLAWTQLSDGWFGEGEAKFFIDGDRRFPTICGTGTEDYFGGSHGFPHSYSTAYFGNTLEHRCAPFCRPGREGQQSWEAYRWGGPPKWSLYRWHLLDPVRFGRDLRVTIQALGWWPGSSRYQPLADDIASVAYWYQVEPHAAFPPLPALRERWPR
jgi:hypothetical protein